MLTIIINLVYRLKRNCYIFDIILLVVSGYLYNKYRTDIPFFAYSEAIVIGLLGFSQYIMLSSKSHFVNRTAVDIWFDPQNVHIKTALFDGPLWFKKQSVDVSFPRAELVIKTVDNPYPHIFKDNKQLLRLRYRDQDVYIMANYFPRQVEKELMEAR